jgi:hypothetical protein
MKRRSVLVAATLVAALPMPVTADTGSGEPDKEGTIVINNVTPAQVKQLCKPGAMILTPQQCKDAKKIQQAAKKPPPPRLPTLSLALKDYIHPCVPAPKALFVRSDPLDNYNYLVDPSAQTDPSAQSGSSGQSANAITKGLSINYTYNMNVNTQTATINGRVSYLFFGARCLGDLTTGDLAVLGVGVAPFVSSNGTWNEPLTAQTKGTTSAGKTITITTTKTSNNALRGGVDFQLGLQTPDWFRHKIRRSGWRASCRA